MLTDNLSLLNNYINRNVVRITKHVFDMEIVFDNEEIIKLELQDQIYNDNIRLRLMPNESHKSQAKSKYDISSPNTVDTRDFDNSILLNVNVLNNILILSTDKGDLKLTSHNSFNSSYDVSNITVIDKTIRPIVEEVITEE